VYGVDAAAINGTQTVDERDRTVAGFQRDKKCRVLLFSNVGSVGLNLTAAAVVILFVSLCCFNETTLTCMQDQCWSNMLVNQVIGRAWRLGQTEEVIVYNLVCNQTVDCLMTDCAWGKASMLEQFLATQHGKGESNEVPSRKMLISTEMKALLASGLPPIEILPPEGAGASSDSDIEIEFVSETKGGEREKHPRNGKAPCKGKTSTIG
jgi:hypothetical protein